MLNSRHEPYRAPRRTMHRLRFLYADLGFSLQEISDLTGWDVHELRSRAKKLGLCRFGGVYEELAKRDLTMADVAQRLGVPEHLLGGWSTEQKSLEVIGALRRLVAERIESDVLNWDRVDETIVALPELIPVYAAMHRRTTRKATPECEQCGYLLKTHWRFCPSCGNDLSKESLGPRWEIYPPPGSDRGHAAA